MPLRHWTIRACAIALLALPSGPPAAQEFSVGINQDVQRRLDERNRDASERAEPDGGGIARTESPILAESDRGDVVSIAGRRYRLWGIAAPAPNEYGGYTSAQELRQILAGAAVDCLATGESLNRMPLARCRVNGKDVAAILVAGGYARDCPRLSRGTYAALERQAVVNVAGGFDLPPECVEN
jgi:endonuclease YncB( thermonuclease family)